MAAKAAKADWVTDLFAVKYSVEEAFYETKRNKASNEEIPGIDKSLRDVYSQAYQRAIKEEYARQHHDDEERLEEALNETKSFSSRDGTDKGILQMEITNDVVTTASKKLSARPTSCIWTKDELEVFRDGYLELKKKSVNLLLMLSDAKSQNKELKKMCKSKENIIKKQNGVLSEQKKQNIKLNTTIIELRKDLDFSDQKLQHLIRTGAQLKDQVLFLKSELEEERKELSKVRKLCKNLEKSLHRHQKEAAFGLMQQGNILKAKFLHKIDKLEGENKALVEELQEERRNHKQTKTALEQLRRHFANLQASGSARDFLDVAEISC